MCNINVLLLILLMCVWNIINNIIINDNINV